MGAELLDVSGDGRSQALWAQNVEARRRAVRVCEEGQPMLHLALLDVTNGGVFWIVALGPAK
jgi:hypothetical protein